METAQLWDFPLTGMFSVGTLEAIPRELLQEILSPVGQRAYKLGDLLCFPILSLISLYLKLSLKEHVTLASLMNVSWTAANTTSSGRKASHCPGAS